MTSLTAKLVGFTATGIVVAGVIALPGALALNRPGTVTISASLSKHTHVDVASGRRGAGDIDVYRSLLYNKRIQERPLGHADMICTTISGATQQCNATYFLPRGELVVSGVIFSRLIYILAVLGGTDLYNNVRGTLTVTSVRRAPSWDLLVFRLTV
jgi:hypothetical protein